MSIHRVLLLALSFGILGLTARWMTDDVGNLVDVRTAVFLLTFPALALAAAHTPQRIARAVGDAFAARRDELPAERRLESAAILRSLGGLTFATGLVVFLGSMVATLNAIASSGGQTETAQLVESLGVMTLGAAYGLALKVLLYDPLAAGLESDDTSLADVLD